MPVPGPESSSQFKEPIAPFTHADTEHYEAYRVYAEMATSPLEKRLIHCAVDAARATLENMRFAFSTREPRLGHPLEMRMFFVSTPEDEERTESAIQ